MSTLWQKMTQEEIKKKIFGALDNNVDYVKETILGLPASYLDDKVFNQDASFLKNSPFMSTLVHNPNHIGCHTLGKSEHFFAGTHVIEREVIEMCAVDILKGEPNQQDGYIASGGTESNMQAVWIFRNYFMQKHGAKREEVAILCSEDSHYSFDKAANILAVGIQKIKVDTDTRKISEETVLEAIKEAQAKEFKYFIVIGNMMTTMFGSVDNIDTYISAFEKTGLPHKIHIDGAYGGFYYPFTENTGRLTFENEHITSFTLDAHKMAQAPYGTGIFLIRKDYIQYANTSSASYVEGEDFTMIGSRSGANAIAVWMILMKNGPFGWQEKVYILQKRTRWMCKELKALGIEFYSHPQSNIITIKSGSLSAEIATEFGLVPDNHRNPKWFKIVIMDHVTIEKLMPLISRIKESQKTV
ncbi:aspartate aminotransferase family protein [Cryomorpha ignava]|uniref:Aspartate aminotransferase family protein n=1 Tax=Cryomorpha ignava TaxID=101383 RepID=A0A7K3WMI3_9FLAO|nr:pyridoxal-dependent decarboxylase [Cryomorpha ignava]NEN22684.1 aspartate aminotransferase family protein [Cryomorpha ignava]